MKEILLGLDEIVGPWVTSRAGGQWIAEKSRAIGLGEDGKVIAGVVFEDYNGANMTVHQAIESPRAITRPFLYAVFGYAFEQIGCRRLTGIVAHNNQAAIRLNTHLGFRLEATLQAAHPTGNLLVYVMFKEDCKWLRSRNHGKGRITTRSTGLQRTDPAAGEGEPCSGPERGECRAV